MPEPEESNTEVKATTDDEKVICPLCGAIAVQEKCKVICRSDVCQGRIVMNCSEF